MSASAAQSVDDKPESFVAWLCRHLHEENKDDSTMHLDLDVVRNPELVALAREEVKRMVALPGMMEPIREAMEDPSIQWRTVKPDYTLANLAYLKGKTQKHQKGSLEAIVENVVKTWEMEASHKVDTHQWKTIVHDEYSIQANSMKSFKIKEAAEAGNYNVLMNEVDEKLYDAKKETFESSHHLFRGAFPAFPWEVLKVFSGPPVIAFSWRHWGEFSGEYKGIEGNGKQIEMEGIAVVEVTEELKIKSIKAFYEPEEFLRALQETATA